MTSGSLFFNLMREDFKRHLGAAAFAFLVFFFSLPVASALMIAEGLKNEVSRTSLLAQLTEWVSFGNGFTGVVVGGLAFIMGISSFSYLHSRQKSDFYHGIPVSRTHLFWANYANGILIPFVLYGLNLLLNLGVLAANGNLTGNVVLAGGKAFLLFLVHYCLVYSVNVLAMVLTGNIVVGIAAIYVLNLYFPALFGVLNLCFRHFFRTNYNGGAFLSFVDKCSAVSFFGINVARFADMPMWERWVRTGSGLAAALALSGLSFFFYRKRGLEAAGRAMVFPLSRPLIRIPIVLLSSLSGILFFWIIHPGFGWGLFGLVWGAVLSHCVIEIIYHFDFRKLFSHWKQMFFCAGMAMAVFCVFRYDLFGYDRYLPNPSALESVSVSVNTLNDWVDYGTVQTDSWGEYYWQYERADSYLLERMELKDAAPVLALVKEALDQKREEERLQGKNEYLYWGKRGYYFSVKYKLKSGRSVYRSYQLHAVQMPSSMLEILESPAYGEAAYPVLSKTLEDAKGVRINWGYQSKVVTGGERDTEMTGRLLSAYQEELRALKPEKMKQENPVASIQFLTREQMEILQREADGNGEHYGYGAEEMGNYPIYPSFEKTIGLLKACGVEVEAGVPVAAAAVNLNLPFSTLAVTNTVEIEQIMERAEVQRYAYMNPFSEERGQMISFYIEAAVPEDSKIPYPYEDSYVIYYKDLPERVKKEAERKNQVNEPVFD